MKLKTAIDNICDCTYPVASERVRKQCGDNTIELQNGDETTLKSIFRTINDHPDEFENQQELENYLMSLAPEGSVGRKFYDDRSGSVATGKLKEQQPKSL